MHPMPPPIVLIGTGTGVGKTHVAERILRALAAEGRQALGYKPVESGVVEGAPGTDAGRLGEASTFHVKPELARFTFRAPVSPHLAARQEGRSLDLDYILAEIARGAAEAPLSSWSFPGERSPLHRLGPRHRLRPEDSPCESHPRRLRPPRGPPRHRSHLPCNGSRRPPTLRARPERSGDIRCLDRPERS